jgi:hypothetical protein
MKRNGQSHTLAVYSPPRGKTAAFTELKCGWIPEPDWTLWRREKSLSLTGI